jgi:hypothetical protein
MFRLDETAARFRRHFLRFSSDFAGCQKQQISDPYASRVLLEISIGWW